MKSRAETLEGLTGIIFRKSAVVYFLFLFLMLLMPFHFVIDKDLIIQKLSNVFFPWSVKSILDSDLLADIVQNIILFMPFGFFLKSSSMGKVKITLIAFCTSSSVECIQALEPGRVPSIIDLFANTAGAYLGACIASRWSKRTKRLTWQMLSLNFHRKKIALFTVFLGIIVILALFVQLVSVAGLPWDNTDKLYIGGAPGSKRFWKGTIHDIKFWKGDLISTNAGNPTVINKQPDFELDFRTRKKAEECFQGNRIPPKLKWKMNGLVLSGAFACMKREIAQRLVKTIGTGKPFTMSFEVSPEHFGFKQEGSILIVGEDSWDFDLQVQQKGFTLFLFVKTTISGEDWSKPSFKANKAIRDDTLQHWLFLFNGKEVEGVFNGRFWPEKLFLPWYSSIIGLILSSPLVIEPLTFYTLLFFVYSIFATLLIFGTFHGLKGICFLILFTFIVPETAILFLFILRGIPIDYIVLCAVPFGALLGGYLGKVWACACTWKNDKVKYLI